MFSILLCSFDNMKRYHGGSGVDELAWDTISDVLERLLVYHQNIRGV